MPRSDFNGDGRDDILWRFSWPNYQVTTWIAGADATFPDDSRGQLITVPHEWNIYGTGDFDGDGYDDILWQSDSGRIGNWLGGPGGIFTVNDHLLAGSLGGSLRGIGDFNGDGKDELLL